MQDFFHQQYVMICPLFQTSIFLEGFRKEQQQKSPTKHQDMLPNHMNVVILVGG